MAPKPANSKPQEQGSTWITVDDMPHAESEGANQEALPPGIKSLKMWGRTMITWGTAARNSTYAQVVEAAATKRDPLAGYAKWVLVQSHPNHPGLCDLQLYLRRRKAEFMPITSGKLFSPGSRVPRVLAEPSSEDSEHDEDGPNPNVDEGL
jgi:hypothetical protein